ncbi:MAG: helix-turn-helix domain-containing protein [Clostridia bacterium]|nr:helix-turn-helix domain-containing protein [Clostridia bacterium]
MYEPTYPPQLSQKSELIPNLHFSLRYYNEFVTLGDESIEPAHIHDCFEIFFNLGNDVSFLVNNKLYPVGRGDAVISKINDIHVCIYQKSCLHTYFCLWIDAEDTAPIKNILNKIAIEPLLTFDDETKELIRNVLFSLDASCKDDELELMKNALLLQLLTLFDKRQNAISDFAYIPEPLQRILDDINDNFAEIRHVNDILDHHFVSSATLNRWFRRYIHLSPREFLESKKLSHAASLLASGKSVTEACMRSGFSECSYFIGRFKKKFGETPLKYKQRFV